MKRCDVLLIAVPFVGATGSKNWRPDFDRGQLTLGCSAIMKRLCIFLFLMTNAACQQAPRPETAVTPETELERLTAVFDAAETQTDLNVASYDLAKFWDGKLASIEERIEHILEKYDGDEQERFLQSKDRWRSHRTEEVEFVTHFFEGGSIVPLIANQAYTNTTKHRIAELEFLLDAIDH